MEEMVAAGVEPPPPGVVPVSFGPPSWPPRLRVPGSRPPSELRNPHSPVLSTLPPNLTHLGSAGNMAEVCCDSRCAAEVVEGERSDVRIVLEEEGEGLANPTGGTENSDLVLLQFTRITG